MQQASPNTVSIAAGTEMLCAGPKLPAVLRYGSAFGAVLAAIAVREALGGLVTAQMPLLLFTMSVVVAARFGGIGPGLVATAVSIVADWYFFLEPRFSFAIRDSADIQYLVAFTLLGTGLSWLSGQLHNAVAVTTEVAQRYRMLSEGVPQLIWTCGPDGNCDHVNTRWTDYTGMPAARLYGTGWIEQIHPALREPAAKAWAASIANGSQFHMEIRLRRHNGSYRWFDAYLAPRLDVQGRIEKWFGCAGDVDEAHSARDTLQEHEERLAKIVATAPAVICAFRLRPDGSACFPYASPAINGIYGLQPSDIEQDAQPAFDRMHPDDVGHVHATIAESALTMTPWHGEFRVIHPTRGEIWVEGHWQPAREPDGSVQWYGFIADITSRRQMEQTLRDHAARLEELAHVILLDPDCAITYWSEGASALYGWSREEAVGKISYQLLKTEFPESLARVQESLRATGRWEGELNHRRRDGSQVVVASHWALKRDQQGRSQSIMEVNSDITERRRVEQELEASEQRLQLAQAAAGIATWDWNLRTNRTVCSSEYGPLYGIPLTQVAPSLDVWLSLVHPDDRVRLRADLNAALAGVAPYDTEFRVIWPDGTIHWLMGKGQVYKDSAGKPVRFVGVNMDITERKDLAEQLRALSASLIHAQDEERRRISRELHDDLIQRVGFITIDVARIARKLPPDAAAFADDLHHVQLRSVETAELIRHIAHELHPRLLDDFGLEAALRSYCEEFAQREEIPVEVETRDLPSAIKREIASCLYGVAQESLLNVSKHAQAEHVTVRLGTAPESVTLEISDDGVGFAVDGKAQPLGLGIVNMKERVRWVGGKLKIESRPGSGTRLTVQVPL